MSKLARTTGIALAAFALLSLAAGFARATDALPAPPRSSVPT